MFPSLFWLLVAWLVGAMPEKPAEQVAIEAGAACERGCIVGADGWVYEVTRDDLVLTARAAHCEVEVVIGTADADAAMWALVSNFYRRHTVGRKETLAFFVSHYSGCNSPQWSSIGTKRSPRITPRADANRQLRWWNIPQRTRDYVRAFFRNEIPNRMPGIVYVLTHGWEKHAHPSWIGPYYAETRGPGSYNSYWKDPDSAWWTQATVRLVAPTAERTEAAQPTRASSIL